MSKQTTYAPEILAQFKPVKRKDGRYAVELSPGRFLHWIESTNNKPCTVSNPDFSMQSWHFIEEAYGVIDYLKALWTEGAETPDRIVVTVSVEREGI